MDPNTPPRPNNNHGTNQQLIKQKRKRNEAPPSPSEETTTCSVSSFRSNDEARSLVNTADERRRINEQIMHLGIASGAAASGLVVALVPIPILTAFVIVSACFMGLLFKIYQRLLLEVQAILQGRGFGYYLPESVYNQLVNTSIHEWMTDTAFIDEYRFMALYFVPGITREQRDAYVDRLVPRHRDMLRRPGLGHLLGAAFMRLIIGDEGMAYLANSTNAANTSVPRRLELTHNDGEHEEGLDHHDDDDDHQDGERAPLTEVSAQEDIAVPAVARIRVEQGRSEPHSEEVEISNDRGVIDFFAGGGDDDGDGEEDLSEELNILIDAFTAAVTTYYSYAYSMVTGYARELTGSVTSTVLRAGVSVGMASVGIGLFGIFIGYWEPPSRVAQQFPSIQWERSTILLSTSLASGIASGFVMLGSFSSASNDKSKPSSKDSAESKK